MSKLQKKPAAHKRGDPTLQNMNLKKKFFYGSFLPSWIRIRIHWPDWIRIRIQNPGGFIVKLSMGKGTYKWVEHFGLVGSGSAKKISQSGLDFESRAEPELWKV